MGTRSQALEETPKRDVAESQIRKDTCKEEEFASQQTHNSTTSQQRGQ